MIYTLRNTVETGESHDCRNDKHIHISQLRVSETADNKWCSDKQKKKNMTVKNRALVGNIVGLARRRVSAVSIKKLDKLGWPDGTNQYGRGTSNIEGEHNE